MFDLQFHRHGSFALRFYGNSICVVSHREGGRRILVDEHARFMNLLVDSIGLDGILKLVSSNQTNDSNNHNKEMLVREFFTEIENGDPTPLHMLLAQSEALTDFSMVNRVPLKALFEITYRCNLRCRHCYVLHEVTAQKPSHATAGQVDQMLDSLVDIGCIDLSISGGEPTLHKNWLEVVAKARELFIFTSLKTNAITFNRKRAQMYALQPANETHVSVYGSNSRTHDEFTAIPGSFKKTIKGLGELQRAGVSCKVNCLIWKKNWQQLPQISSMVEDLGHKVDFDAVIYGRLNGDQSPRELQIDSEARDHLISDGYIDTFCPMPCSAGKMKLKVSPEGTVSTCEFLPSSIGNSFDTQLDEVWFNRTASQYSDMVVKLSRSEQNEATVLRSCPGLNYLNTGQLMGRTEPWE